MSVKTIDCPDFIQSRHCIIMSEDFPEPGSPGKCETTYISTFPDVMSAQQYLSSINLSVVPNNVGFDRIFVFVEYSNGENFRAEFFDVINALDFLSKC